MKRITLLLSVILVLQFTHVFADTIDIEKNVALTTPTGKIFGTLRQPDVHSDVVVLLIAGSGPTDRDGNIGGKLENNSLKMLAIALAQNGIASLRYDKRGIGKSQVEGHEEDLRFNDYVLDAVNWIKWLKSERHLDKVYIVGHSEGSLIGMLAAQQEPVKGYVSIAGAGRPADVILREQLQSQPDTVKKLSAVIMDSLLKGVIDTNVNPFMYSLFRPSVQPYLISWFKLNPAKEIAKLKVPALIIQGTTDMQVTLADAKALAAAQPDAKLVVIDKMNHIFKEVTGDKNDNIKTYSDPTLPIVKQLPEEIVKFIKEKR